MERETFEQLLSDWLDEPQRDELRARVDAAAADSDERGALRAAWERLDGLIRAAPDVTRLVYWPRMRERFLGAVADDHVELAEVDRHLAGLPGIEHRVRWERLQPRICAAVQPTIDDALAMLPPIDSRIDWQRLKTRIRDGVTASVIILQTRRRRNWRIGTAAAGLLAAAAALALFVWWPFGGGPGPAPQPERTNFAAGGAERIGDRGQSADARAAGIARVAIVREVETSPPPVPPVSVAWAEGAVGDSELFLMIEPRTAVAAAAPETFGF